MCVCVHLGICGDFNIQTCHRSTIIANSTITVLNISGIYSRLINVFSFTTFRVTHTLARARFIYALDNRVFYVVDTALYK